jgi:hypothetical protein
MPLEIFHVPLYEVVVFMLFGVGLEAAVTGLSEHKSKFLIGFSSSWYVPIYALVPFLLYHLTPALSPYYWFFRGLAYAIVFSICEFVAMGVLELVLGQSPSENNYLKSRWNIRGLTRMDYWPIYFVIGLLFEWIHLSIR